MATSVYILNHSATSALKLRTPSEALTGMKPRVDHFKIFGCLAYVYIDPQQRLKFDFKSWAGIFIGYYDRSKAYKIIDLDSMRVHISRDIRFFEEKPWNWSSVADSDALNYEPSREEGVTNSNEEVEVSSPFDQSDRRLNVLQETSLHQDAETSITGEDGGAPMRYRKITDIYNSCSLAFSVGDPTSYEHAARS